MKDHPQVSGQPRITGLVTSSVVLGSHKPTAVVSLRKRILDLYLLLLPEFWNGRRLSRKPIVISPVTSSSRRSKKYTNEGVAVRCLLLTADAAEKHHALANGPSMLELAHRR